MIKEILKTCKVNHYIKNAVVFVPIIFSVNFTNADYVFKTFMIFTAFCFISSAVYILNDLADIEQDRKHPTKRNRPVASGKIPIALAVSIMIVLLILSSFISFVINPMCAVAVWCYFILNIFYSLFLKNIVIIDATCIAIGFIFKILGGCFAIQVIASSLVILMTFFLSNFFTYSKRRSELQITNTDNKSRPSLLNTNTEIINQFILINAILAISFYITYVLNDATVQRANTQYLYLTAIPFTLIIYRLLFLINSQKIEDDPIIYLEQDTTTKWLIFCYIIFY